MDIYYTRLISNQFQNVMIKISLMVTICAMLSSCAFTTRSRMPAPAEMPLLSAQNVRAGNIEKIVLPVAEQGFGWAGHLTGAAFVKRAARALAFDSVLNYRAAIMPSDTDYVPALVYFNIIKNRIDQRRIHRDFYALGFLKAYRRGFSDGEMWAFSNFSTSLNALPTEMVRKSVAERPLLMNFDLVANTLCQNGGLLLSPGDFSKALYEINVSILEYLNRNFAPELSYEEQNAALLYYKQQLHAEECAFLYPNYLQEYGRYRRLQGGHYFNSDCYLNTWLFMHLCSAYISTVCDAALSYGKGNPEFAMHQSFPIMGEVGELLGERVLPILRNYIFNNTLLYHYDFTKDMIRQTLHDLLDSLVVDTRTQTKHVLRRLGSGDAQFTGHVEVKTIVNLGLQTEDIELCIDHHRQEIKIIVPRTPKLLQLVHEDHKLVSGKVTYDAFCLVPEILKRKPLIATSKVSNADLDIVKSEKNRIPTEKRSVCTRNFRAKDKKVFMPVLKNLMEPTIANLPHSFYNFILVFGQTREVIVNR